MATLAKRGSGTPATTGTTWANTTNAVDGTVGTNPATNATWTNATSNAVGTIEVSGYDFSAIGASDVITNVSVTIRHLVNNTGRVTSIQYQPFSGGSAIGSPATATITTAAHDNSANFTITRAQLQAADFKIRATITHAGNTQSLVFSLDHIDVTVTYDFDQATSISPVIMTFTPIAISISYDPSNLNVDVAGTTAELTWDASPTLDVVDYFVFRRTPPTGAFFNPNVDTPIASNVLTLSHDDVGLSTGNYEYQVFGRVVPFVPTDISGLLVWYDPSDLASIISSGGFVSQLSDKSGNAKHLVQATGSVQPATGTRSMNGLNLLDFSGGMNLLASTASIPQPFTVFMVAIIDKRFFSLPVLGNNAGFSDKAIYLSDSGGGAWGFMSGAIANSAFLATNYIITGKAQGSSNNVLYINNGSGTATSTTTDSLTSGGLALGYSQEHNIDGGIGEIIIYNSALNDTNRDKVRTYLNNKWGVY